MNEFCDKFKGGFCDKAGAHVPVNYCVDICKKSGKKIATPISKKNEAPQTPNSCCGGGIKKIISILKGYTSLITEAAFEKLLGIDIKGDAETAQIMKRAAACGACEKITWFEFQEYLDWVVKNAGQVASNIADLTILPELEIRARGDTNKYQFCALCKCYLPAKWRVKSEKCPLDKWSRKSF
jgi:hypothetical protein